MNVTHARITNLNDFTIEDRHDGVPYKFEPKKTITVPLEAAALFFGMPVDQDGSVTFTVDHGRRERGPSASAGEEGAGEARAQAAEAYRRATGGRRGGVMCSGATGSSATT